MNNTSYNDYSILIIGDSCLDCFIYGSILRLTPEAPAPIFNPTKKTSNGGMSLNVKNNIEAIGANCDLLTNNQSIVKTRFVDERTNYLIFRLDENDKVEKIDDNILKSIKNNIYNDKKYDAIIISDYCKGYLSEDDIDFIASNNKYVFLDTKKILESWCKNVFCIKINHHEYDKTKHTIDKLNIYNKLIITHSEKGCEFQNKIYPVKKVDVKDLSGAGDTFISALTCEWVRTKDMTKSIDFAQKCASIVVQKKGVATIS